MQNKCNIMFRVINVASWSGETCAWLFALRSIVVGRAGAARRGAALWPSGISLVHEKQRY